jgi:hypothetical protein
MITESKSNEDVQAFLEKIGFDCQDGCASDVGDRNEVARRSNAARSSDIYRRSLARACLSELRHTKAA